MSYEIHLCPGDRSETKPSLPANEVEAVLLAVDGVEGGEGGYRVDDADTGIWIEIDAGFVDVEGDLVHEAAGRINRIWLILSSGSFEASQNRAFTLARELANALGWEAFDPQTGRVIDESTTQLDEPRNGEADPRSWDPFRTPRVTGDPRPLRDAFVVGVGLLLIYLLIR